MANVKTIRINTETGEVEYYYPMELTSENEPGLRDLIKVMHYETGWTKLGNREFRAVFIPVTEEQYRYLVNDEKKTQDQERMAKRCIINDGHGGTKLCPRQIPNPAYIEGGKEPKMIVNRCEECPCFQSHDLKVGRTILFAELTTIDEAGEEVAFDPASPEGYYSSEVYGELCQEFLDFVRAKKPKYVPLAELLVQEYMQVESSKKLNTAVSTINSQTKVLRGLVAEFLQEVDYLY